MTILWKSTFAGDWKKDWNPRSTWGLQNTNVVREDDRIFLRVKYPQGSASPAVHHSDGAPLGGASIRGALPVESEYLWLRYDLRLPVYFDFVKGGKMPGLAGGALRSGGVIPNGTDGWSARLMWRDNGRGEVYAYLPTSKTWGTSYLLDKWRFPADGHWHTIEMELKLNTPGKNDGFVKIYLDGQYRGYQGALRFRDTSKLKIDTLFFETFFGGGDPSWATPKDVYADFSRFIVSTSRVTGNPFPTPAPVVEKTYTQTEVDTIVRRLHDMYNVQLAQETERADIATIAQRTLEGEVKRLRERLEAIKAIVTALDTSG